MDWFRRMMAGRYGVDQLSNAMILLSIVLLIISSLIGSSIINMLAMIMLILSYGRVFSKNINKRREENMRFLRWWSPISIKLMQYINRIKGYRTYRYFKCSGCGQTLRVPRGKGRVHITCPKCKNEFTKNT
ncbi:hypothetical protein [Lutispora thermophila]|uniref:Zn-finger containing protein n=1 Tax=Lutispora thermophila DSM 19022 TaxID=1122184 RepID=A0A1M6DRQ0_9FIRM|nr:hypothetical protein [Lutispora thermophila]SHI75902.1 hypothetical protein SAMN02745176_01253 [Lutispora thermophila DSM 19022]